MQYDLGSPLVCEGIVGDGCGGGRIFAVKDGKLIAYDPYTDQEMVLRYEIPLAQKIQKRGCIITIVCHNEVIEVDLQQL